MFDWIWEILYMVSKTIFKLIDGLILCANKLCGIDKVAFEGEETDLMTYLFFSNEIGFAFRISALLATIFIVIFTVFMIIRTIAKDKAEGTPTQIAIKAFKTLLMFFFVPAVMFAFVTLGNAFVSALYSATQQSAATPGGFLFNVFAREGGMKPEYLELFSTGEKDYYSTSTVSTYMSLGEFPFIFSWIAGGVVLFGVGSAMLIFVDRVLSLVILYIAAPISISTSMIDDGARFKLWRDQFLSKFIMGYGMILAINIYALVCNIVMAPEMVFFPGEDSAFLELIMKLLIIGGGALTMQKSLALIGNLVSHGGGSNELRDSMSAGGLARMAAGAAKGAAGMALGITKGVLTKNPVAKAAGSITSDALSMMSKDIASDMLGALGWGGSKKGEEGSGSKNNEKAEYGSENKTKDAMGDGFKMSFDTGSNANNESLGQNKKDTLGNAINSGGNKNQTGGQQNGSPKDTGSTNQNPQKQQQQQQGGENN